VAQGGNFGIGLVSAGANDNVVEDNIVEGNTNGIILTAGTLRNTFRRNLVVGNPPAQVSVDYATTSFSDIRNLSGSDSNTFQSNVCLTSVNAPCPALGPTLTASPNPAPVAASASLGMTRISWTAPDADAVEVRIGSPSGGLFASGGNRGSTPTGSWVSEGMTFYLQDVTNGKPLTAANTLATLVVRLQKR
jgi:parallel beta-helix repeat protein